MITRRAEKLHSHSMRDERRAKARRTTPPTIPTGVRQHVLETGRRIIEEDRAILKHLEAYDRGEWRPK